MQKFEILVLGAGLSGLTTALAFGRAGFSVALIEPLDFTKFKNITANDLRTTALSANSKRFYNKIGAWKEISLFAGAIEDIKIVDADYINGDSPLKLWFAAVDVGSEPMGYIIENNNLKTAIFGELQKLDNVKMFFGSGFSAFNNTENFVNIILKNGENLQGEILVACDGKNSPIRNILGIEVIEKDYNQTAITFNVEHYKPHNQMAIERFMPTGPFAALPLANEHQSSIVWTVGTPQAKYYLQMPEDKFKAEIEKRLGDEFGDFKVLGKPAGYPLRLKYCKQYFSGRTLLAGDSAHSIHPISGQGFNQGVKDIELLVNLITEQRLVGLNCYGAEVFEKYQKKRVNDNMQMIYATDFFNSLFSNDNKIISLARRLGIKAVDKMPNVKKFFIKKAMGEF